jgi:putative PEP-CTERM system TPR-repeat lipoprotein
MMLFKMKNIKKIVFLVIFMIAMTSCDWILSDEERINRATEQISKNNYQVAIIELKKVLQHDNTNVSARLLLGQSYLALGDGMAAEKELRWAESLGVDHVDVIIPLGRAMLLQHNYDKLLNELQVSVVTGDTDKATILWLRGEAYLGLRQFEEAQNAYLGAMQFDSKSVEPLIGLARLALQQGRLNKVESLLNQAVNITSDNHNIWIVKGLLYQRQSNYSEAETAFNQALASDHSKNMTESKFQAKVGLITSQMMQGKLDDASRNVKELKQAIPKHPYPNYLQAWLAYQQKNYELASDLLLELQKQMPEHMPSIFLLGASNYALGHYEQANYYLTQFVNAVPTHIQGRRLLGATRLKLQQPEQAMEVLNPGLEGDTLDAVLLVMAGQAAAFLGDAEVQLRYLKKAAEAAPERIAIRTELARAYMNQGAMQEAITELESIQHLAEDHRRTDLLLIYARLRSGDFAAARKLANDMLIQSPNDPGIYVLLGSIELIAGDRPQAHRYFLDALRNRDDYLPARISLARMDLEDGNLDVASEQFDRILLIDKKSVAAMLGHAQIAEQRGEREQAVAWVERARSADKNALLPRIVLARYYLLTGDAQAALRIAKEVNALKPNDVSNLLILGRAQQQVGKTQDAIRTLEALVASNPQIISAYIELANSYANAGSYGAARNILKEALKVKPDLQQLKLAQVRLEILAENYDAALQHVEIIQRQHKKSVDGFSYAGDIYLRQKRFRKAQQAYQQALDIKPMAVLTIKLARAYSAEGKSRQAIQVLERGLKNLQNDVTIRAALAASYQQLGENTLAEKHYQDILKIQPNNPIVLNNLALLYLEKDAIRALSYAQQAFQLAPQSIAIADTLGWLLLENERLDEGLAILQRVAMESDEPTIQYHLAMALAKNGKSIEARERLTRLLENDVEFKERQQAHKFLNSLTSQ